MSRQFIQQYADLKGIIVKDLSRNGAFSTLYAAPTDSLAGYTYGGVFIDNLNGLPYVNRGASTSSWKKLLFDGGTIAAATVTALTFTSLSDGITTMTATIAEINRVAALSTRVVTHGPSDAATLSLTAALHDGKTLYVTKTDGLAITLPVPVAGMRFRIIIGATIASASTIKSFAGTHLMIGHALMGNNSDNTVVDWQAIASSTYDTIDLLGTSNSTGGMEGQEIIIEGMSTTRWFVSMRGDASGTEASPFSDTVT